MTKLQDLALQHVGHGLQQLRGGARRAVPLCLAQGGELYGVRLLSYDTIRKAGEEQNRGRGRVVPISMRWRLGYHRVFAVGARVPAGFGHFGFGGSGAWGDPDSGLAVAMVLNQVAGTPFGDTRFLRIGGAAVRSARRREDSSANA